MLGSARPAPASRSDDEPWLPLGPQPPRTNVAAQREDRASLLWLYKNLLAFRRDHPALHRGTYQSLEAPEGVLAYERRTDSEVARIALNFSDQPRNVSLGSGRITHQLHTNPSAGVAHPNAFPLGPAEGIVTIIET